MKRILNELADHDFIALKCQELLKDIEYIEKRCGVKLAGDRLDLQHRPYKDCVGKMTKAQTEWFFSYWRRGIWQRYESKLKG